MLLEDVPWLRSDLTGVAVPVVGAFKRFLSGVVSHRGNMVCSADALGKLLSGKYMSNKKPVYTITTFRWRALHPSADEACPYLTLVRVIVADNAPMGASGDAPGGACLRRARQPGSRGVSVCRVCTAPPRIIECAAAAAGKPTLADARALREVGGRHGHVVRVD